MSEYIIEMLQITKRFPGIVAKLATALATVVVKSFNNAVSGGTNPSAGSLALAFTSKKSRAPKAEGIPYDKSAR